LTVFDHHLAVPSLRGAYGVRNAAAISHVSVQRTKGMFRPASRPYPLVLFLLRVGLQLLLLLLLRLLCFSTSTTSENTLAFSAFP
jgi:hypothetical protein